jgi:hypothetical protein
VSHININILYIRIATPFSCYFDKRLTGRFALPTKYPNLKICANIGLIHPRSIRGFPERLDQIDDIKFVLINYLIILIDMMKRRFRSISSR